MNIQSLRGWLRAPWLPCWLVMALLPWGRSAELGTLLCGLGTCWLWWRHRLNLAAGSSARLWLGLIGAYVLAALWSWPAAVRPQHSLLAGLGLLRYLPLGLYVCWALDRTSRLFALYRALAWLLVGWCLDAWLQMATGWSLGGPAEPDRLTGIFGAGNLKLGPALAALSPFLLWYGRRCGGGRGLLLAWLLLAWLLLAGPVVLSGARSAWIELALAGICFAWQQLGSWRQLGRLLGWAALVGALLAGLGWQFSPRFHARLERSLSLLDGSRAGVDTALTGRLEIWGTAVRMIEQHPWLGVGVRGFRYAYPAYAAAGDRFVGIERCAPGEGACHPHQWLLEVLTETGLVGGLCWLSALLMGWWAWRRAGPAARAQAFPATVALLIVLFPCNTHLAFYSAWWGLVFAWLLALWCAGLRASCQEVIDGRN